MVAVEKMPSWMRAAEIVLGLVSLVASIYVLAYPLVAILTLILFLSIGLIFLGWRDIAVGVTASFLPNWLRAANIGLGLLAFIFSAVVIADPGLGNLTLITLLFVALVFRGIAGLSMAVAKQFSNMLRGLSAAVGVLCIILAIVGIAVPSILEGTLVVLLSFGLLITGLEAIAVGAMGRKIAPITQVKV